MAEPEYGKVKSFGRVFGFVTAEADGIDVFVHINECKEAKRFPSGSIGFLPTRSAAVPQIGQRVVFLRRIKDGRPQAYAWGPAPWMSGEKKYDLPRAKRDAHP